MTPEEQNKAIDEIIGGAEMRRRYPAGEYGPLPKYTEDLNAMHEAEKTLKFAQFQTYQSELVAIWARDREEEWGKKHHQESKINPHPRAVLCATASQRAEAFLRTIGKYKSQ